ncbi:unnamed protein product [Didymodactylos carnosus]|uniref:Uncharacterized protein n=1 Tax=Didymodactylos carnosus TaxID=1234261 RepID=A0A816BMQ8_9BILA|nr:unnamed protein product [Didymodactylos carnosus]CAF4495913.1 unnamed protein product [Didymodactylos carnosus]
MECAGKNVEQCGLIATVGVFNLLTIVDLFVVVVCPYLGTITVGFDDLPPTTYTSLPSNLYENLLWTNGYYLQATAAFFAPTGYPTLRTSGNNTGYYEGNLMLTIQAVSNCTTFTFNSVLMIAGWTQTLSTSIVGYYNTTQLYNEKERPFSTLVLSKNKIE